MNYFAQMLSTDVKPMGHHLKYPSQRSRSTPHALSANIAQSRYCAAFDGQVRTLEEIMERVKRQRKTVRVRLEAYSSANPPLTKKVGPDKWMWVGPIIEATDKRKLNSTNIACEDMRAATAARYTEAIGKATMSTPQIAKVLGAKDSASVHSTLHRLEQRGVVVRVGTELSLGIGPNRTVYWRVK